MDLTKKQQKKIQQLQNKIDKFQDLEDNWDNCSAKRITKKAIWCAKSLVEGIDPYELDRVQVTPTHGGGIVLEIDVYDAILSLTVSAAGKLFVSVDRLECF